jgi:hypothetical protein
MHDERGRCLPLSLPRRLVGDLLHFAAKVPTVPVQRRMSVASLRDLRRQISRPPGWCAIFTKAFALAAAAYPELRRAYLPWPWPRLYEHPFSIASVAVSRRYEGEDAVFFAHLRAPDRQSLTELDACLCRFKEVPVESIGLFRRALRVSRLPRPLRRLLWWVGLNSSGPKRAKRMGTFGVSVYSGLGAESLHPLSPLTTTLNYGVIRDNGTVTVRLTYDHRVMDGATIARALALMEEVLNEAIRAELRELVDSESHADTLVKASPSRSARPVKQFVELLDRHLQK